MISGIVDDHRQAIVRLVVLSPRGGEVEIAGVIDTGFTGLLTLPPTLVIGLALPFHSLGRALLADGSESIFDIHNAVVIWDGRRRSVLVSVADTDPLIGMGLLDGHELMVEAWAGGEVRITAAERRDR